MYLFRLLEYFDFITNTMTFIVNNPPLFYSWENTEFEPSPCLKCQALPLRIGELSSRAAQIQCFTPLVTSTAHFCQMHCVLWILIFLSISTRQKACSFTSFSSFRFTMEKFPQLTINIDHCWVSVPFFLQIRIDR